LLSFSPSTVFLVAFFFHHLAESRRVQECNKNRHFAPTFSTLVFEFVMSSTKREEEETKESDEGLIGWLAGYGCYLERYCTV
jgi:hypothetical protein